MSNFVRAFVIGAFLVLASSLAALAVNIPFTFSNGSPINPSQLNANFSSLKTAVDKLEGSGVGVKAPLVLTGSDSPVLKVLATGTEAAGTGGALWAESKSSMGVYAVTSGGDGAYGILGEAVSNKGLTVGVYGKAEISPLGTAVAGRGGIVGGYFEATGEKQPGHDLVGVYGVANKPLGIGVRGIGTTWGGRFSGQNGLQVEGDTGIVVNSGISTSAGATGTTLYLSQNGGGALIQGRMPGGKFFHVLNDGTIRTTGDVISRDVTLTSDRNAKTNFSSINALEVLSKVTQLPISRWNFKTDTASVQHIGPVAQDFHKAFGLNGTDDKHVSSVDLNGVAFAAIQGLNQKLESENAQLRNENAKLQAQLQGQFNDLAARLERLERQ